MSFSGEMMGILRKQIKERGAAAIPPCLYLWQGEGLGLNTKYLR